MSQLQRTATKIALKARQPNARWTDEDVLTMIDILKQATIDGNTSENGFKESVWQQVSDSLNDELKTKRSSESKFSRVKKDFKEVKFLSELSGFGYDSANKLVIAESQVWDSLLEKRPHLKKWQRSSFPWYEDMDQMFGSKLAVGKHSFFGGEDDTPHEISSDEEEESSFEFIRSRSNSVIPVTPTPRPRISLNINESASGSEEGTPQISKATKRHRDSASIHQPTKRIRVTGVSVLQDMSESLKAAVSNDASQLPEDASASLDGQAFTKIQSETCLTDKGILAMLEVLADTSMARRYLLLQRKSIREDWIKQEMRKHAAKVDEGLAEFIIYETFQELL